MPTVSQPTRTPNRLIREKSPYLLQHALNPVDWYPWGEEAFAKAQREDKPIFLSIGYSTCHWCHVMERESFENDAVAELLNRWFVPVKVDREERPDVDRLYMTALQAMGLGGGWPLNAFLTPDREPFYGGTYFPPESRHGRPGMTEVLPRIHEVWSGQRAELVTQGSRLLNAIEAAVAHRGTLGAGPSASPAAIADRMVDCYRALERSHDPEQGGFGTAPKFPSVANLNFLFRHWSQAPGPRAKALAMAFSQLDAMRAGGIHDHLGGGFHRYATDAAWLVPHFEKMLYDQAQLAWAYLDGHVIAGSAGDSSDPVRARAYAETARGILTYVLRDLTSPEGGFYSAEDADSEGEEGRFYVWTHDAIDAALGADAALFRARYGVEARGNFEHGTSILHEARGIDEVASGAGLSPEAAAHRLDAARARLLELRGARVRPHRDDKILTAWNGLMISAFARGARFLDDAGYAAAAARAATFIWERLRDAGTGALARRWREGEAALAGQLDDYANLAAGFIDLYQATFDPVWLERAGLLTEQMIARFWDDTDGGFFDSPAGDPHLAFRMKDDFDGAELAGNSVAAGVLYTLAVLSDREEWRRRADRLFAHYTARLAEHPVAMPQMLVAMDLASQPPRHIVLAGRVGADDLNAMIAEFHGRFLPRDVLLVVSEGDARDRLAEVAPFVAPLVSRDAKATAYVCLDYACQLPVTDRAAFAAQLESRPAGPSEEA